MRAELIAPRHTHGQRYLTAFVEGLRRHGVATGEGGDFVVMWGHKRRDIIDGPRPYVVLEQAYVGDRLAACSVGWNGLNGRAWFPTGPARWRIDLQPWRTVDGPACLIGQVPGDASLHGADMAGFYRSVTVPAVFRPHPLAIRQKVDGLPLHTGPLAQAFERFSHVITWNSNTAVEAVIAGVPAVAVDRGSMAWDVSGRDVNAAPPRPDRRAWADRLTWCQWTAQELADGTAWEAVRHGYRTET